MNYFAKLFIFLAILSNYLILSAAIHFYKGTYYEIIGFKLLTMLSFSSSSFFQYYDGFGSIFSFIKANSFKLKK